MSEIITRKKLIEVALPLEAINIASAHEKLNQSQGETRRADAVGLTESEHAARPCDG